MKPVGRNDHAIHDHNVFATNVLKKRKKDLIGASLVGHRNLQTTELLESFSWQVYCF